MDVLQELHQLKGALEGLIKKIELEESEVFIKDDNIARSIIRKFIAENGEVLDKDKQQELYKKVSYCNRRKLSLVKLMKEIGILYEYVKSNKDWKDIRVIVDGE